MTVHAVLIVSSTTQSSSPPSVPSPEPPDFDATLLQDRMTQNVLGSHAEVLSEQAQAVMKAVPINGTTHLRGVRRFDSAEDKTTLLDSVENGVVIDAEWYEVRYHTCDHDEQNRSGCPGWTAERSGGTVPSDV